MNTDAPAPQPPAGPQTVLPSLRPTASCPGPGPGDTPSVLECALVTQAGQVTLGAVIMATAMLGGLSLGGAVALGAVAMVGSLIWALQAPMRHLRRGRRHRALALTRHVSRQSWISKGRGEWVLMEAVCLISLAQHEKAKELMGSLDGSTLTEHGDLARRIDMAVLYCRMMAPESALAVLGEVDRSKISGELRSAFLATLASAHFLMDHADQTRAVLEELERTGVSASLRPGLLSLQSVMALDFDGDPVRALDLSRQAVAALTPGQLNESAVRVNFLYVQCEVTGDDSACMEGLRDQIGHEADLGCSGQAAMDYLLARGYWASGMVEEARSHLATAHERPCPAALRARIQALASRIEGGKP